MLSLDFNLSDFRSAARAMGAAVDQVPFALANTLNEAALATRRHEVDTVWPGHVQVRNRGFLAAALRTDFASKRNLSVSIYDRLGRAHLKAHDRGGVKRAKGKLAIPSSNVRRGAKGVAARQKPAALVNSFRVRDSIFQRVGKKGRVQLMFTLKPSAQIKPDVPFTSEFQRVMRREVRDRFGPAMAKAMRTRR